MSGPSGHRGIRALLYLEIRLLCSTRARRAVISTTASVIVLGTDAVVAARPATAVQLAHACSAAGFDLAIPASWGDELVAVDLLRETAGLGARPAIVCTCPLVRCRLFGVGDDLEPFLVARVAPPIAVARYLRALYQPNGVRLTYVGACPSAGDAVYDERMPPSTFFQRLETAGIDLSTEPETFQDFVPPDRRRFSSLPGGVPSPGALALADEALQLVEVSPHEIALELAQLLLSGERMLIDLAPSMGCACSGASDASPAHMARSLVEALEPPRAVATVIDTRVEVDLSPPPSPPPLLDLGSRRTFDSERVTDTVAALDSPTVSAEADGENGEVFVLSDRAKAWSEGGRLDGECEAESARAMEVPIADRATERALEALEALDEDPFQWPDDDREIRNGSVAPAALEPLHDENAPETLEAPHPSFVFWAVPNRHPVAATGGRLLPRAYAIHFSRRRTARAARAAEAAAASEVQGAPVARPPVAETPATLPEPAAETQQIAAAADATQGHSAIDALSEQSATMAISPPAEPELKVAVYTSEPQQGLVSRRPPKRRLAFLIITTVALALLVLLLSGTLRV
jgi:hypothetical protein